MSFFNIEPEISGSPAPAPSREGDCFVFDTWLGDDLIRPYPAILVTTPVKRALAALEKPTGFSLARARARTSRFFRKHSPGRRLPVFWALEVTGKPGQEDMGLDGAGVLVVSHRVLDVLLGFRIGRSVLTQYVAPGRPGPGDPSSSCRT